MELALFLNFSYPKGSLAGIRQFISRCINIVKLLLLGSVLGTLVPHECYESGWVSGCQALFFNSSVQFSLSVVSDSATP